MLEPTQNRPETPINADRARRLIASGRLGAEIISIARLSAATHRSRSAGARDAEPRANTAPERRS